MPQFDLSTFPTQLVWLVIAFVLLYVLMARVALPRIGQVLEERQEKIDDNLDTAEKLRAETEADSESYEAALVQAREQAPFRTPPAPPPKKPAAARKNWGGNWPRPSRRRKKTSKMRNGMRYPVFAKRPSKRRPARPNG